MNETIPSGFQSLSQKVFQYHSYIVALFSGIVIGFLTNYLVTFVFPLPYWQGLSLGFGLLAFSVYLFLLYSPEASRGKTEEIVPQTLHEFLHANFDKLLFYIKLDWEGYAFHKTTISADGWMAPVSGVEVKTKRARFIVCTHIRIRNFFLFVATLLSGSTPSTSISTS